MFGSQMKSGGAIYARLCDAVRSFFAGSRPVRAESSAKQAEEGNPDIVRANVLGLHYLHCVEYGRELAAYRARKADAAPERFGMVLLEFKRGDSAGVIAPVQYGGLDFLPATLDGKAVAYFPTEDALDLVERVLEERIRAAGCVAYLGTGRLREIVRGKQVEYSAQPKELRRIPEMERNLEESVSSQAYAA